MPFRRLFHYLDDIISHTERKNGPNCLFKQWKSRNFADNFYATIT